MRQINNNSRAELDINFIQVFLGALGLTIIIYAILFPFQQSYLGILLYQRGFTQHLAIFFSCIVAIITVNKYQKIIKETNILNKIGVPDNINFHDHKSYQLVSLQEDFARTPTMITKRLSRILNAYILSGSRKIVTELALDDSSFYLSASESSYALPRILVWAIPLLGFIGTVLGISQAVNGFNGFLNNTAQVDQIKEGIATVTTGLAIAFDTTLLALFLSVMVMIPLVIVEKMESQLLLNTEIYINDHILPRLKEHKEPQEIELKTQLISEQIINIIEEKLPNKYDLIQSVKDVLPTTEELVNPAEIYAKEAAKNLIENFMNQLQEIQIKQIELIDSINEVNKIILQEGNLPRKSDFDKLIKYYIVYLGIFLFVVILSLFFKK
ncbi:MotA/TolQ/ExbB proton channel family protein [Geminocystis sp. GBBB08]|uniref:MotA/TolQ/ExbB proton channel family protein n=1 Tax=Geminocystis sp. GBBB08 TaxID=2604140 RepID=UPI0027E2EE8F|nr:MotA/TolQ/ExbB proton channel family protein [Geminocystis sp. GBBB08]MBL1208353.1 MotA/TolQ/ExbB proton channel family protein [Geminocystis sp. GBBB08]